MQMTQKSKRKTFRTDAVNGDWMHELPGYRDEPRLSVESMVERGGKGSGHHGHKGRPGEVGGSAPGSPLRFPDMMAEFEALYKAGKISVGDVMSNMIKAGNASNYDSGASKILNNPDGVEGAFGRWQEAALRLEREPYKKYKEGAEEIMGKMREWYLERAHDWISDEVLFHALDVNFSEAKAIWESISNRDKELLRMALMREILENTDRMNQHKYFGRHRYIDTPETATGPSEAWLALAEEMKEFKSGLTDVPEYEFLQSDIFKYPLSYLDVDRSNDFEAIATPLLIGADVEENLVMADQKNIQKLMKSFFDLSDFPAEEFIAQAAKDDPTLISDVYNGDLRNGDRGFSSSYFDADSTERSLVKAAIVANLEASHGIDPDVTQQILDSWARTSNKTEDAIALQIAASQGFDISLTPWHDQWIEKYGINEKRVGAYSEAVEAIYAETQEYLSGLGYSDGDTVLLFRGISAHNETLGIEGETVGRYQYSGNPLESWSVSPHVASRFGSTRLVAAMVPIENIVSTARTGFGCLTEGEVVVLGSVPDTEVFLAAFK